MNLESPEELFQAISTPDVEEQERFVLQFKSELEQISAKLAEAFGLFIRTFLETRERNNQWVQAYMLLAIESCVSAVKMLAQGHVNGSGNTMRVAYEALCMAMLLAANQKVRIEGKEVNFLDEFERGSKLAHAFKAVRVVVENRKNWAWLRVRDF